MFQIKIYHNILKIQKETFSKVLFLAVKENFGQNNNFTKFIKPLTLYNAVVCLQLKLNLS